MFNSQYNQDKYLEENIFKGYKNGFFVDVGSHDGITINNTLYFDKYNNWTGINIEPIEHIYNKLVINRPNNININIAISNINTNNTIFLYNSGYTEMLSGIEEYYDEKHLLRLKKENIEYGGETNKIIIETKRLENILNEYNIKHINYLSIDVECAELEVIKSINFNNVFIDIIGVANKYENLSSKIIKYLKNKDFILLNKDNDIFMINKKSKFLTTNNIIIIGSNDMWEIENYTNKYKNGVFIEADPNIYLQLKENLNKYNLNYTPINKLITNIHNKEYEFNIFNNNSCSSSIYKPNVDKWMWNNVSQNNTIKIYSTRMKNIIEKLKWNNIIIDVIIDVQGAELEVIKSFDNYINNINCIQIESSSTDFYIGQSTVLEVHKYLINKGFVLLNRERNTIEYIHKIGQGDLIYSRNTNVYSIFKNYQESI